MALQLRLKICMDEDSESMRYVAEAERGGPEGPRISKHGRSEVVGNLYRVMIALLGSRGYNAPQVSVGKGATRGNEFSTSPDTNRYPTDSQAVRQSSVSH